MQVLNLYLPSDTRYMNAYDRSSTRAREFSQCADLHFMCSTETRQRYGDSKQNAEPKRLGKIYNKSGMAQTLI